MGFSGVKREDGGTTLIGLGAISNGCVSYLGIYGRIRYCSGPHPRKDRSCGTAARAYRSDARDRNGLRLLTRCFPI